MFCMPDCCCLDQDPLCIVVQGMCRLVCSTLRNRTPVEKVKEIVVSLDCQLSHYLCFLICCSSYLFTLCAGQLTL